MSDRTIVRRLNSSISLSLIPYIFSFSITNYTFLYFCYRLLQQITQRIRQRKEPLHLSKREVCFDYCQKKFGINDGIGSLLEHLPLPKRTNFLYQEERQTICWRCSCIELHPKPSIYGCKVFLLKNASIMVRAKVQSSYFSMSIKKLLDQVESCIAQNEIFACVNAVRIVCSPFHCTLSEMFMLPETKRKMRFKHFLVVVVVVFFNIFTHI